MERDILLLDLDGVFQVLGPHRLADSWQKSPPHPLQGERPGPDPKENLASYRRWLFAEIRKGKSNSPAAGALDDLLYQKDFLAGSCPEGRSLTLAYVGPYGRPYAEAIRSALLWLEKNGWPPTDSGTGATAPIAPAEVAS